MAVTVQMMSFRADTLDAFQYDGTNVTTQDVVDWLTANLDMETHFVQQNGNTVLFGQNGAAPWYVWMSSWVVRDPDGGNIRVMDHAILNAFYGPSSP